MKSKADFVIVTALEEERDAVLAKLPSYQRLAPTEDDVRIYFCASLPVTFPDDSIGFYQVVVMPLLRMGRVQASLATTDAIRRWQPRYVILVGIAGGIAARKVALGDILISDQIVDYELQKITPRGPQVRWEVHRAAPRLVGAARNFMSQSWQASLMIKRPVEGLPARHIGPIASGDKVIAFGEVLDRYRDKWPMLVGVEMEAAGVAAATFESVRPPGFFMVRGVSDLADEEKGSAHIEKWRLYACDIAASYTIALLKGGPVPLSKISKATETIETSLVAETSRRSETGKRPPGVPDTVPITAGSFWMGSADDDPEAHENEKPRREIMLPAYRIGRYPVTNGQYADFVWDTGHSPPTHWERGKVPVGLADHPVVNVSYEDAEAYCNWLGQITGEHYRLPTEEEWEKAARGGIPSTIRYPWGEGWEPGFCNTQELGQNGTTAVHEFEQVNQSPCGVVDMVGNVWEWTSSLYMRYPGSLHESLHFMQRWVVRGGSWRNSRQQARISCRGRYASDTRRSYLGFRVIAEVVPVQTDREAISAPVDRIKLRQNLVGYFNESELRDLCFDLDVSYDALPGAGVGDTARELIAYLERRGRLSELMEACQLLRPNAPW